MQTGKKTLKINATREVPFPADADQSERKAVAVDPAIRASNLRRLRRIEGQVRGLARMVEDDRYCIDIVTQLSAARAALRKAEEEILADHVAHCVEHAIASGNKGEQRRKVGELIDVLSRSDR